MKVIINQRVLKIISKLRRHDLSEILNAIDLLCKHGNRVGMPISRPLGKGIFELRVYTDKWYRLIYIFYNNSAVIVHIVIKKSNKLQARDLKLAKDRIRDYKQEDIDMS